LDNDYILIIPCFGVYVRKSTTFNTIVQSDCIDLFRRSFVDSYLTKPRFPWTLSQSQRVHFKSVVWGVKSQPTSDTIRVTQATLLCLVARQDNTRISSSIGQDLQLFHHLSHLRPVRVEVAGGSRQSLVAKEVGEGS
jgi:hypothetical protein